MLSDGILFSVISSNFAKRPLTSCVNDCAEEEGGDKTAPSPARIMDIVMLVKVSGKERTRDEYGGLFADSGFRLQRTISTSSEMNIIEAAPV
jgi:hypothetical protein